MNFLVGEFLLKLNAFLNEKPQAREKLFWTLKYTNLL